MNKVIRKYTKDIWNVPNVLTMLRLALIPVFAAVYAAGQEKIALVVFLVASFTDFLDGYLARKYKLVTDFGKLMDPLADKLMVITALICQGVKGVFPWAAIIIVMVKESAMVVGGWYMLKHGIVVYANMLGKTAMVSFIAALVLSFWHAEFAALGVPVDRIFLWIAVTMAVLALVDYCRAAVKKLREAK